VPAELVLAQIDAGNGHQAGPHVGGINTTSIVTIPRGPNNPGSGPNQGVLVVVLPGCVTPNFT
jgi:hypothetical protein